MVFGLQLSFARLGSTVNFNVMGPLYKHVSQFYSGYMCTGVVLMIGTVSLFKKEKSLRTKHFVFFSIGLLCDVALKWTYTWVS